jgi:hypothetical protein
MKSENVKLALKKMVAGLAKKRVNEWSETKGLANGSRLKVKKRRKSWRWEANKDGELVCEQKQKRARN